MWWRWTRVGLLIPCFLSPWSRHRKQGIRLRFDIDKLFPVDGDQQEYLLNQGLPFLGGHLEVTSRAGKSSRKLMGIPRSSASRVSKNLLDLTSERLSRRWEWLANYHLTLTIASKRPRVMQCIGLNQGSVLLAQLPKRLFISLLASTEIDKSSSGK